MALTLQRKLELAGDLAKVQPLLQRLHLLEPPRKRRRVRSAILALSVIGAAAALVIVLCRGRCCGARETGADTGFEQADSTTRETGTPAPELD